MKYFALNLQSQLTSMSFEEEQIKRMDELKVLVTPVMEWLYKTYGDPHTKILIDSSNCQLLIGEFGFDCFEHIKD